MLVQKEGSLGEGLQVCMKGRECCFKGNKRDEGKNLGIYSKGRETKKWKGEKGIKWNTLKGDGRIRCSKGRIY